MSFLVNVHRQVFLQRRLVLEYLLTSTALEGSLTGVYQYVAVQRRFLREGLVTHVAFVRPVAGVA